MAGVPLRPFGRWERRSSRAPWAVIPRKRLDVAHRDMAFGLAASVTAMPYERGDVEQRLKELWTGDDTIVTLSVRTSFDLLLQALRLPRGSHIIMSGVTIRDMVVIAEHHGLLPLPVDLDIATLTVDTERLEALMRNTGARAVVVAHVFGARMDMDKVIAAVRRCSKDAVVIEDAAEAFEGLHYKGHDAADVSLFSFGTIKTATAFGGCMMRVKDDATRQAIKRLHYGYPLQRRAAYAAKLLKYAAAASLLTPAAFGVAKRAIALTGAHVDNVITRLSRGFPGDDLMPLIRVRPCLPLLLVLERVLRGFQPGRVTARREMAEHAVTLLRDVRGVQIPGMANRHHTFWLFPIMVAQPNAVCKYLSARGFDVTSGTTQLGPVTRYVTNRCPKLYRDDATPQAAHMMASVVYLPVTPELSRAQLVRLCDLVADAVSRPPPTPVRHTSKL